MFRIRFFFDAGSGICFWAGNEAARQKYDYPIEASTLPMSENLWREAVYICAWYDTSIDWEYPPDDSPWSSSERNIFNRKVRDFFARVQAELGSEYELVNESKV